MLNGGILIFIRSIVHKTYYRWILWGLGAFLFFSEYFVRTSSSVMVGDLMRAFHLDALGIGALSVFFYYPYTFMQVPVGLLMDKYGPGRLLILMSLLFSLGCFVFASAHSLFVAEMARLLMGVSAAFAFVGTLKMITVWFDLAEIGFLAGLTQALGMLGAAIGEGPVAYLTAELGWRSTLNWMAAFIFLLFLLLLIFVQPMPIHNDQDDANNHLTSSFKATLLQVIGNPQTWYNALFAGLLYAPTLAFGELWGVNYLSTVHHLSHQAAASSVSWVFLGWALGGPFFGKLSDRLQRRKPIFYLSAVLSLLTMTAVLYWPHPSQFLVAILLFLYGIANTGLVVSYALSGEINAPSATGTTMALTNMSSVLLGTCCHPIIGWLLVRHAHGATTAQGLPLYSAVDYQFALAALPMIFLLALVLAFKVKETNCQRQVA